MGVSETTGMRMPITPAVKWLLAVNVGIYFLQVVLFGSGNTVGALGFDASALPSGWWTLITYMFVHAGIIHLALNMFVLWSFAPRLEDAWGTRALVGFYLWCGIGGALTHLILVRTGYLVGASAAVYGILLAYAMLWREEEIFLFGILPVRARWLVVWLVGINLLYAFVALEGFSSVAAFAHLGGLLFAWLYLKGATGGGLSRVRERVSSVPDDTGEMPRAVPRHQKRARAKASAADEVVARSKAIAERRRLPSPQPTQRRGVDLDAVLDKISRTGLDSLTAEERRLLEKMSRDLRKDGY